MFFLRHLVCVHSVRFPEFCSQRIRIFNRNFMRSLSVLICCRKKICHIRCDKLVIDSFSSLPERRENLRHLCNSMTDLRTIWHDDAEQVYRPLRVLTRSCARPTADRPRDAMRHSKFCQPLHNSLGTSCITNPEQNRSNEVRGLGI